MSKEEDNKAVVVRWFTDFWGENVNLSVVDDIASPDMLLKYSLHEPRRGHDVKAFMTDFRAAGGTAPADLTVTGPAQALSYSWAVAQTPQPGAGRHARSAIDTTGLNSEGRAPP
jgi:hypothetical protein